MSNQIEYMKVYLQYIFLFYYTTSFTQTLKHTELLGRPTDNSITLQVFFNEVSEARILYDTQSGSLTKQTAWQTFPANEPAEITLSELSPDTRYYYKLCYRVAQSQSEICRPEFSFSTKKAIGKTFTFIVQADPHLDEQSDTAVYKLCLQNQIADKPDFVIDLGDFLMSDKLRNTGNQVTTDTIDYRCNLLRSYYSYIGHSTPLFIALGNHEGEAGWNLNGTENNIGVTGTLLRKKYFPNPFPNLFYTGDTTLHPFVGIRESYYAWTWGDALFIVLDPYWFTPAKPDALTGWRWTLGKTQYDWLKNTLEKDHSKFKFVFAHQIVGGTAEGRGGLEVADLYEWGGKSLNGKNEFSINRPGWYKPVKELLQEHRVNIFFHGHDHFFGKQDKDCLIYQETPQPSHPNFQNLNYAYEYGYHSGLLLPNSGHLRVTVSDQSVKVEYIKVYLAKNETSIRKNRDIAASYQINVKNCYDSLTTGIPVVWNDYYKNELIYPNPFSNQTKIEFTSQRPQQIDLTIYNQQGIPVRSLLKHYAIASGKFQIYWDGFGDHAQPLPSGMYFYSMTDLTGSKKSGKLQLIK